MKDNDLKSILDICNKATRGPWISSIEGRDHDSGPNFILTGGDGESRDYDIEFDLIRTEDQDFIALARNILPELVKEISRLQKILNDNAISF